MTAISDESGIDPADRALALLAARGRCCICARTIARDGVRLLVERKRPKDWGGSVDLTNLWAACSGCRGVKGALLSSLRKKVDFPDVHTRIGETLKALGVGEATPSWLLEIVAGHDNWRARLRELREPGNGWEIEAKRHRIASGKVLVESVLKAANPWSRKSR